MTEVDTGDYLSTTHGPDEMRAYLGTPLTTRFSPATLRAAWWAGWSLRRAARDLESAGVRTRVTPPPVLPAGARRGVEAVLRRSSPTCLERCVVLQAWLAAHGVRCEVVVGVSGRAQAVAAHAWLDVEGADPSVASFREIHRMPPP